MIRLSIYNTFFRLGIYLIGVVLSLLIFFSCEYDISDVHLVEIEDAGVEYPQIELDFQDSLIVIYEKTSFHYQISLETQWFHEIEIHLDGNTIYSSNKSYGEFTVNPSDGQHTLEMFIHTSSGSGTIRNQLGGEHWEFYNSWILVKGRPSDDPDDPYDLFYENVKFTSVGIKDDYLVLKWEPYEGDLFYCYGISTLENRFRVSDVNAASFTDLFYVGGMQTYVLSIIRTNNTSDCCDTVTINYTNPISYAFDSANNITFSWPPCKVPANFLCYDFYQSPNSAAARRVFNSYQLTDTTFTMSCDFCDETQFVLRISAKGYNGSGEYLVYKWVDPSL